MRSTRLIRSDTIRGEERRVKRFVMKDTGEDKRKIKRGGRRIGGEEENPWNEILNIRSQTHSRQNNNRKEIGFPPPAPSRHGGENVNTRSFQVTRSNLSCVKVCSAPTRGGGARGRGYILRVCPGWGVSRSPYLNMFTHVSCPDCPIF